MLRIATQIANGLAKAHESGIVHRDLSARNVMLTDDGVVKAAESIDSGSAWAKLQQLKERCPA